jgi:hypothetical protein
MGEMGRGSRRGVLSLAAGLLGLLGSRSALAQSARDCDYGWVNGLLVVGGEECDLSGVPSHLASGVDATDGTTSTTDSPLTPQERQLRRREHQQKKRDNARAHKQEKRGRKRNHKDLKQDSKFTCDDFLTQADAQNWWLENGQQGDDLDPNNNGVPCEHLP